MTDCVAALRWVRENIARFGGDPDTVMIYEQSVGGGALPTAEQSRDFSRRVLRALNIGAKDIGTLRRIAWKPLFAEGSTVANDVNDLCADR